MRTDDLDYHLPSDRIATHPATPRDAARLMVIDRAAGQVHHRRVADLPNLALESPPLPGPRAGDLVVFNRSRVLPAYFTAQRNATGGRVTGLYLAGELPNWHVMLEARGRLQSGEQLALDEHTSLELIAPQGRGEWTAAIHTEHAEHAPDLDTLAILTRLGQPPLPPYIRKARKQRDQPERSPDDVARYNTVYADEAGSVAAPTAGLHFTDELLGALRGIGVNIAFVTLHVGLGTFAPVRTEQLEDHDIHEEWLTIPPETLAAIADTRRNHRRIIPIGTTTVRALESLPDPIPDPDKPFTTNTRLFITPGDDDKPGFNFRFTDALMTNFHLPQSTLLAMVAALPDIGLERLKHYYQLAIDNQYRFYSYGDAMLIL